MQNYDIKSELYLQVMEGKYEKFNETGKELGIL